MRMRLMSEFKNVSQRALCDILAFFHILYIPHGPHTFHLVSTRVIDWINEIDGIIHFEMWIFLVKIVIFHIVGAPQI